MVFKDRFEAGIKLAEIIYQKYQYQHVSIVALPRGGVEVGYEVARRFGLPLEIVVACKLGAPNHPEFGIGAVAEEDVVVLDKPTIDLFRFKEKQLQECIKEETEELNRRIALYRYGRPLPAYLSRTIVIVVDDGLATGVTARAAIEAISKHQPVAIVFAAPVCAMDTSKELEKMVDDVVCLNIPFELQAVGLWYEDFEQVSDERVIKLIQQSYSAPFTQRS